VLANHYSHQIAELIRANTADVNNIDKDTINRLILEDRDLAIEKRRADVAVSATKLLAEYNITKPSDHIQNHQDQIGAQVVFQLPDNQRDIKQVDAE
jgi:hypothetical protein